MKLQNYVLVVKRGLSLAVRGQLNRPAKFGGVDPKTELGRFTRSAAINVDNRG
jgi:hypothetical protein